jgi:DNA-binding transcriptional MerR regulator
VRSSAAVADRPLVRTAEAARALSIDPSTLSRWAKAGIVKPAIRTAGGQARWDLDELRRQVDEHLEQRGDS